MIKEQRPQYYIHLMGGLGNQLFQVAAGLYYSLNSSAELIIDDSFGNYRKSASGDADILSYTSKEFKLINAFSGNIYMQKITGRFLGLVIRVSLKSNGNIAHKCYKFCLSIISTIFLSIKLKKLISLIIPNEIGFQKITTKARFLYFCGYFQTYRFASDYRVKEKLSRLSIENSSITRYKKLAAEENPLIVHIRLGDYLQESNFGTLSLNYYKEAIDFMVSKFEFKSIWVFSDEIDKAKNYLPKQYVSKCRWIDDSGDSAVETLEKMRLGSGYIIGNSSFSWWGAFLSHKINTVVIAPKPWFTGIKDPVELIPPNWIRINR
jgi:hypothetical protein